jgi:hypothetical protein
VLTGRFHHILCAFAILTAFAHSAEAAPRGPLETIRQSVRREVNAGKVPIIVVNIDGTILDNRPRSQAILRDFVAFNPDSSAEIADSIYAIRPDSIHYYVVESFRGVGIRDLFVLESALKFWADNFFSNRYVLLDIPVAGATSFIQEMHDSGAMIIYISGRGRTTMLEGTMQGLLRSGFPIATPRTLLVMKPQPRDNNTTYKMSVYNEISRMGRVVAAFENEPRDVNMMKRRWPSAQVVLIRGQRAPGNEPLQRGIAALDDFTDTRSR